MTVDRALRAAAGCLLGAGADRLDVALVEDHRARQDHGRPAQVGVAVAAEQHGPELGVPRPASGSAAAEDAGEEARPEAGRATVRGLEPVADRMGAEMGFPRRVAAASQDTPFATQGPAAGRVDREAPLVGVDEDRADVELGAAVDVGDDVRVRPDPRRVRVDEEGDADDDGAKVERPGDGRGDHRQGKRSAFVGPRQVRLAGDLDRRAATAGADRRRSDTALRGATGVLRLGFAGAVGGGGDLPGRAVGNSLELAADAGGQRHVDHLQLLLAVAAVQVHREGAVGAGLGALRLGGEPGVERPLGERGRAGAAAGGAGQGEVVEGFGGRRLGIGIGGEVRPARPAEPRARQRRPVTAVEAQHERAERDLGRFGEGRRQLPGDGIGADMADLPHGDPVPSGLGVDEDPVLVAGGGVAAELLTEIDVAAERAGGKGRGLD